MNDQSSISKNDPLSLFQFSGELRNEIYGKCALTVLGKLFFTNKQLGKDVVNILIERMKGLESRDVQYQYLRKNSHSLKAVSRWIKEAPQPIKCLKFIFDGDSNLNEGLLAATSQHVDKLVIEDVRLGKIRGNKLQSFKQAISNRVKPIELQISFDSDYLGEMQNRVYMAQLQGALASAGRLYGEDFVAEIFKALPNKLSSLELSGRFMSDHLSPVTANKLSMFDYLPRLKKLALCNWVIEKRSFQYLHDSLTELKISRSLNMISRFDIRYLGLLKKLDLLELDESAGLTSECFGLLPRTITRLFITVWAVKVPLHNVPTENLLKLPPDLKELKLSVLMANLPQKINFGDALQIPKYQLRLKHVHSFPKRLTSLACSLREEVTEDKICSHLTSLVKLENLK